jgi:NADH-quinone oxidoreductase subunit F
MRDSILEARNPDKPCISVCAGTGCHAYGCDRVAEAFETELKRRRMANRVSVRTTGCHGFCERGPLVVIHPERIFYQRVQVEDVPEIVEETLRNGRIVDRLLYVDPESGKTALHEDDVNFYRKQTRIVFGSNGLIRPTEIRDYLALEGYQALGRALTGMSPEEVLETVTKSGLRGRGGAGFPTGRKWALCRDAEGDVKYVICNADEGDPGAYMDRSLLEGNPHLVIEGMLIGAYAIGATEGWVYVRHEYPLAVRNLTVALEQARALGLLGPNVLGTGFGFDLHIARGAGAFVSGEETALMQSIEGRRSSPRPRPPYPAVEGLFGKPTNINNVETWANVPKIVLKGPKWFSSIGTRTSKGTKIFSLVGKVKNTGLVEVPMGITLREVVFDIGGGILDDRKFKAVQTGGPSGGCLPESFLDTPIDFESLAEAGSMMGSGGMIVMDEDTCAVDMARYFLSFTQNESCGKCVPCRVGTKRMLEILERITEGKGEPGDIEKLRELAKTVKAGSLCGLGQTAPNPVLSTLRFFEDEYRAHIERKECPAGVCKALTAYWIDPKACIGCGLCLKACPVDAIHGERKKPHEIDQDLCTGCGSCYAVCPKKVNAVKRLSKAKVERRTRRSKAAKSKGKTR